MVANFNDYRAGEATCDPSYYVGGEGQPAYQYLFTVFPEDWETLSDAQIKIYSSEYASILEIGKGMHPRMSPDGRLIAYIHNGDLWTTSSGGVAPREYTRDSKDITERYRAAIEDSPEDNARWENYE